MIFTGRRTITVLTVTTADELIAMGEADLALARQAMNSDDVVLQQAWRRLTTTHADRLTEILDDAGCWPSCGPEAAYAAWKIAQHADRQLDVQRRVLALITGSPEPGVGEREIAMLRDRVLVNEGRNQIYGTQVAGVVDGAPVLWPVDDPDGLAERRARVGLPPPLQALSHPAGNRSGPAGQERV
jgi:hypothetical protein